MINLQLIVWSVTAMTVYMYERPPDYNYPMDVFGDQLESDQLQQSNSGPQIPMVTTNEPLEILRKTYDDCRHFSAAIFCIGLKGEIQNLTNCDFKAPGYEEKCKVIVKFELYTGIFVEEKDILILVVAEANHSSISVQPFLPNSQRRATELYCSRLNDPRSNMTRPFRIGSVSRLNNFFVQPTEHYCTTRIEHIKNKTSWITEANRVSVGLFEAGALVSNLVTASWPFHIPPVTTTSTTTTTSEPGTTPRKRRCKTKPHEMSGTLSSNTSNLIYIFLLLLISLYF